MGHSMFDLDWYYLLTKSKDAASRQEGAAD